MRLISASIISECANPRQSGRWDTLLQLPLLHGARPARLHDSSSEPSQHREPVPLCPEQAGFCAQVLKVSLRGLVVPAKRMTVSITVLYYELEFLLGLSMVFYDFSQLIHQAAVIEIC